jgi:putative ABC transport system permease protein
MRLRIGSLWVRPAFSAIVIVILALGIGVNTSMFSLVYAILLRPFPYPDADRLVRIQTQLSETADASRGASVYDFDDWRTQQTGFRDIAAYISFDLNLEGPDAARSVAMTMTTPSLFTVLGVTPLLGRTFTEAENQVGGDVFKAVLSESLWSESFGRDPRVVGRTIRLRGATYTVIGVMPGFCRYPDRTEVWVPLQARYAGYKDDWWKQRDVRIHTVLGRLRPEASLEEARANLQNVADALGRIYPATNSGVRVSLVPLREAEIGTLRPYLVLLGGAVVMVLMICCVNVANLLLARMGSRQEEIAIRVALGASRWRIVRQLLAEAVLLSVAGGLLGAGLAVLGVRGLLALIPVPLPPWMHIEVDWNALVFNFAVALVMALPFGLAPALHLARLDANPSLRADTRATTIGKAAQRLRHALVVAEIALSMILLAGAGLMMRSFVHLRDADAGIARERVLTVQVSRFLAGLTNDDLTMAFAVDYRRLLDRATQLPGVTAVGGGDDFPYAIPEPDRGQGEIYIRGQNEQERKERAAVVGSDVSPGYFNVLRVPLLEGRDFTDSDDVNHPRVVVVSRRAARTLFPGRPAIGQQLSWGKPGPDTPWTTVIGVVGDTRWRATERDPGLELYFSYRQFATLPFHLILRTQGDPALIESAVRRTVREVNPAFAIRQIRTMDLVVTQALWQQRLWGVLFFAFAALALALAVIGVYGVMSYLVNQRTREIGIRMALGATPAKVLALIASQGIALIAAGMIIGLAGSLALTRSLHSLVFGISAADPATFAIATGVLAGAALAACCIPTLRAARVDPTIALHQE